jgi:alanyl-tRNA synthetase
VGACDCDRWLEIWNLVFMQFERDADGRVTRLPRPSIDTGMGLERVASVLQGVPSNYETDLFRPILNRLATAVGRAYDPGPGGFPFRVIADHIRACSFLIGDGVIPGNEGRGYVLRRILRRASRFARVLGAEGPSLHALVPVVVETMGSAYPELRERAEFIRRAIEQEEDRFCGTLAQGLRRAEELVKAAARAGRSELAGEDAFILHDTFGFPLDLTRDIAEEQGMTVDEAGFEAAMARQRDRARAARTGDDEETAARLRAVLADTPATEFVGYATGEDRVKVLAVLVDAKPADEAAAGSRVEVVLDRTPFYAEAGGQVSDRGHLRGDGLEVAITSVRRHADGRVLHGGEVRCGRLRPGDEVQAVVESGYRKDVARNHTATHLLHGALRALLGGHVTQAGSLVAADHLRFDFTHLQPLAVEELARIETLVNEWIADDLPIEWHRTSYQQAVDEGAVALFGEKYGETVRVVKVGEVGAELCGGTHVGRTGEVGLFKILAETGIGSGLRRIEAVTGRAILERLSRLETRLAEAAARLNAPPEDLLVRLDDLLERLRVRERQLAESQGRLVVHEADRLMSGAVWVGQSRVVAGLATLEGAENLRAIGDLLRERMGSGVALLAARNEHRVQVVVAVTADLVRRGVNASRLVGALAGEIGGGGGGRPDLAQAGGSRPDRAEHALDLGAAEARRMLEAAGESPASR